MIDYDKLKLVHNLACKYSNSCDDKICSICVDFDSLNSHINYVIRDSSGLIFVAENIIDIIEKLTELTEPYKPKPNYKEALAGSYLDD